MSRQIYIYLYISLYILIQIYECACQCVARIWVLKNKTKQYEDAKLIDKDQRMWKPLKSKGWIKNEDESCESNTISLKMLLSLSYISSSIFNSTLHRFFIAFSSISKEFLYDNLNHN